MCSLFLLLAGLALAAGAPQQQGASSPEFECGLEDGTYMDPYQCDRYWTCEEGVATSHYCDDGLVFDDIKALAGHVDPCDTPFLIDCSERPILQEPTHPNPQCVRRHGIFEDPDPTVCNVFHVCKNGFKEDTKSCSTGLHFNPVTGICEWPLSAGRVGCVDKQLNCIPKGNFCCTGEEIVDSQGISLPHPTYANLDDCQKFYVCLNKITPQESSCSKGMVYNDKTFLCDFPENVPDCVGWYRDHPDFKDYYVYEDETAGGDLGGQDTPL